MAFGFGQKKVGIDLGTANTSVFVEGQGIVLNEPSYIAKNLNTNEIIAVGEQAKRFYGKTPPTIQATRPIVNGVIDNLDMTIQMIHEFLKTALNNSNVKPYVVVSVPLGITPVERRAVIDAVKTAGAREAVVMFEPFAAAIGEGLPVQSNTASMIVDIGGGTTDIATISYGGFLAKRSMRLAGDSMNEAIALKIRDVYRIAIDETTAENIKINIASASMEKAKNIENMKVAGRNIDSGLPVIREVESTVVSESIQPIISAIVQSIRETLEDTPPDSTADIINKGIQLSGGGSLIKDLSEVLAEQTHLAVNLNRDNVMKSVGIGLGESLRNFDLFKDSMN